MLSHLKKIWLLRYLRRVFLASKYINNKYAQIFKWGLTSEEDYNYTFSLTPENLLYLAQTISVITGQEVQKIESYFAEIENNTDLKNAISKLSNPDVHFGKRLGWYAFARILKPKIIVETGVEKGSGAVVLCEALLKNIEEGFYGKYIGTDIDPKAGLFLNPNKYKLVGEIIYGDSLTTLKALNETIDLFINDSDHSAEYEYKEYQTIKNKISDSAIILGDNAHANDKLSVFSKETGRNFIFFKEFPRNHWYEGGGIGISFLKK